MLPGMPPIPKNTLLCPPCRVTGHLHQQNYGHLFLKNTFPPAQVVQRAGLRASSWESALGRVRPWPATHGRDKANEKRWVSVGKPFRTARLRRKNYRAWVGPCAGHAVSPGTQPSPHPARQPARTAVPRLSQTRGSSAHFSPVLGGATRNTAYNLLRCTSLNSTPNSLIGPGPTPFPVPVSPHPGQLLISVSVEGRRILAAAACPERPGPRLRFGSSQARRQSRQRRGVCKENVYLHVSASTKYYTWSVSTPNLLYYET